MQILHQISKCRKILLPLLHHHNQRIHRRMLKEYGILSVLKVVKEGLDLLYLAQNAERSWYITKPIISNKKIANLLEELQSEKSLSPLNPGFKFKQFSICTTGICFPVTTDSVLLRRHSGRSRCECTNIRHWSR